MLINESDFYWQKAEPEDCTIGMEPAEMPFTPPLKIYKMECEGFTGQIAVFEALDSEEPLYQGTLPYEPDTPIACDGLAFQVVEAEEGEAEVVLHFLAESGIVKIVLAPYLNTTEGMEYISNGYNDDSCYTTDGRSDFKFNNVVAEKVYVSSNHYIGFGLNTEQLRVLRRDGCSTAIYRQVGMANNELEFLKIRFEGYTVYNNRVDANRLIFELFLFSNNDMFLYVIRTPTSGNTGDSSLICGSTTIPLSLFDGQGGGAKVCFYCKDDMGTMWDVQYGDYETPVHQTVRYLLELDGVLYGFDDTAVHELPLQTISAATFLEYGIESVPSTELLTGLACPTILRWNSGLDGAHMKAKVKAYPYPQILSATADMSHISIIGIKLLTAEYSGEVGVSISVDHGQTWSEEYALGGWLNTDREQLWESLGSERLLLLRFVLHDNAVLSRFKITYIN